LNDDLISAESMFVASGQLLSQWGSITGDSLETSDVELWWPGYISDTGAVKINSSGPLVHGWLNSQPTGSGENDLVVINQSFESVNMTHTEDYINALSRYLKKTGVFGKAVVSWAVWMNDQGYTLHMAFDGPPAYDYYLELLSNFGRTDLYAQATSTTLIGLAYDLQQMPL
jgi:hypothetical protein